MDHECKHNYRILTHQLLIGRICILHGWLARIGLGLPMSDTLPKAGLASAELPRSFHGASADLPHRFVFWPAARAGSQGMSHHCWIGMLNENRTHFRFAGFHFRRTIRRASAKLPQASTTAVYSACLNLQKKASAKPSAELPRASANRAPSILSKSDFRKMKYVMSFSS